MSTIIQINNLTKQYGRKAVLKNLNLKIEQGEIFGIIGMSGSGKTTLLNSLIGFLEPEEGEVLYHSKSEKKLMSVFHNTTEARKTFGFATQVPSFYPGLTMEENLDHFASLYHLPQKTIKHNTGNLLKMIGLESEKNQLAKSLSGGMEKRLGIACSLVHNPSVLILDEPTANLDPVLRDSTWDLIQNINKMGTTVIVASHLLEELEPICDRIGILHDHSLNEIGTPDQLKTNYTKNEEISLKTSGKQDKIEKSLRNSSYVAKIKKSRGKIIVYTPQPLKALYNMLKIVEKHKVKIVSLEVSKPSLKEVFESIYQK